MLSAFTQVIHDLLLNLIADKALSYVVRPHVFHLGIGKDTQHQGLRSLRTRIKLSYNAI